MGSGAEGGAAVREARPDHRQAACSHVCLYKRGLLHVAEWNIPFHQFIVSPSSFIVAYTVGRSLQERARECRKVFVEDKRGILCNIRVPGAAQLATATD